MQGESVVENGEKGTEKNNEEDEMDNVHYNEAEPEAIDVRHLLIMETLNIWGSYKKRGCKKNGMSRANQKN